MIQKLRRKFIMVNMALVSIILIIVFTVNCFTGYQNVRRDSMEALHRAITRNGGEFKPPKLKLEWEPRKERFFTQPVFCVLVSSDGSVKIVSEENAEVSIELAQEAARLASLEEKNDGIISPLGLRYLKEQRPEGLKIAFAERSGEVQSLVRILVMSACLLLLGLLAFFIVSLYLARWALKPVEEAWEQQRQFVADASHELKTPVTVILANAGILLAHPDETIASQKKWVENTKAEALRMKKLVDDLLFLAKNDDGHTEKCFVQVDFSFVVSSGFLVFESVAFEEGITTHCHIAPDISILGDMGQLQQLVMILLDNACKYVEPKGQVTVWLSQNQDKVKLRVNNTGSAIPPEELKRIFDRFYRFDKSRARAAGGVGLGLAIANRIVSQHKGRMEVESLPQKGTTFTITFPVFTGNFGCQ